MPRRIPRFDLALYNQAQLAVGIVKAGELARVSGEAFIGKEWSAIRLESLYELAYLRVFAAWEVCLESVFYRSLCGYASMAGQELIAGRRYYPSLAAAQTAVLKKRAYLLWHNPQHVIDRCQGYILPGGPCLQATIISSNLTRLADLATVRHRVVHDQADAKVKFDTATLRIAGRTYPASRPGKFLSDWDKSVVPHRRWLEVTTTELTAMANQIV